MMTAVPLSDLIASASLLLAVLAILFSVWHEPVMDVLKLPTGGIPGNLTGTRDALSAAFWSKAFPLTLGGAATILVFFPEILDIGGQAVACSPQTCHYDAVKAAFVLTQAFAAGLTAYCGYLAFRLREHHDKAKIGKA